MAVWYLYLIRCKDDSIYTGISTDVLRRLEEHRSGGDKAARYLRGRGPLTLARKIRVGHHQTAARLEWLVKKKCRAEKEALIHKRIRLCDLLAELNGDS